jgi:hypothetical protein
MRRLLMFLRRSLAPMAASVLMVCVGCGGRVKPALTVVQGVVTLNGAALNEGNVNFSSASTGNGAIAKLEADGKFMVKDGMLPGEYQVTITPPTPTPDNPKAKPSDIPPRYRTNAKTDLVAKISPAQNNLKFELKP